MCSAEKTTVLCQVLLSCLPEDRQRWHETIDNSRRLYSQLRHMVVIDPRQHRTDPTNVNPLSLHDDVRCLHLCQTTRAICCSLQNPWQQYFCDEELRACIVQDVTRTFPELAYFQVDTQVRFGLTPLVTAAQHAHSHGLHSICVRATPSAHLLQAGHARDSRTAHLRLALRSRGELCCVDMTLSATHTGVRARQRAADKGPKR